MYLQSWAAWMYALSKRPKGRQRFLSRAEYKKLHDIIEAKFPEHLAEFVVNIQTGMRAGEQYSVTWRQVHLDRKKIELTETKNTEPQTVHLNQTALDAINSVRTEFAKPSDVVFPRNTQAIDNRWWFFPCFEEVDIDVEEYM
jgi:integrase